MFSCPLAVHVVPIKHYTLQPESPEPGHAQSMKLNRTLILKLTSFDFVQVEFDPWVPRAKHASNIHIAAEPALVYIKHVRSSSIASHRHSQCPRREDCCAVQRDVPMKRRLTRS